jgi:glutamate---cysteine ligase / carboxylate-amine ligase
VTTPSLGPHARRGALPFRSSERPTLGVEWEVALVDAATGDLAPRASEVLEEVGRRPPHPDGRQRVTHELLTNTVELVTGVHETVAEAVADLHEVMAQVRAAAEPLGLELACSGTHPFAQWSAQTMTEGPRYAERTQWWGRQMLIWGVHVHVGMPSAPRVLPVLDAMLTYAPHLQALSASSPFWAGVDTGYASNRALMFQQLPTAGLPFQFARWEELEAYVGDLLHTGVIDSFKDVRWDVRPSPGIGTLEVRVCDGVPTESELAALTALTHCLVVDLDARLEAGEQLAVLPPWHVQENKWRAARYGLDAIIITNAAGDERLVTDDLDDVLTRLEPVARRLGCSEELASVAQIPVTGASYQRQRAVAAAAGGDLKAVVGSLVRELREGRPEPAPGAPGAS